MKKEAFTLIELIAVLVILAILALIVTPLVMNIIRKARIAADKRSIDAYGRSIELAIASYLLDETEFPTSVDELTIEYSGDEVVCSTTTINEDLTVYLTGCTVAGRSVDYTYGSDKSPSYTIYNVGDEVTYNGVDYYVIETSGAKKSTVTMLKKDVLTASEVNQYGGVGTENNHVNMYNYLDDAHTGCPTCDYRNYYRTSPDGAMAYYTSPSCSNSEGGGELGCRNDYESSEIKYVVDAWAKDKLKTKDLAVDQTGYSYRLITLDELDALVFSEQQEYENAGTITNRIVYHTDFPWLLNCRYWTMTPYSDTTNSVNVVIYMEVSYRQVNFGNEYAGEDGYYAVRPVITLKKSALSN